MFLTNLNHLAQNLLKGIIRIMAASGTVTAKYTQTSCLINGKIASHGKEGSRGRERPSIVDFDKDFESELVFSVAGMSHYTDYRWR
jgi:hypothetical protein